MKECKTVIVLTTLMVPISSARKAWRFLDSSWRDDADEMRRSNKRRRRREVNNSIPLIYFYETARCLWKEDVKKRPFLACECKVNTHQKIVFQIYLRGDSDIYLVVGYWEHRAKFYEEQWAKFSSFYPVMTGSMYAHISETWGLIFTKRGI